VPVDPQTHTPEDSVTAIRITLQVLLALTSLFLTILILLHKGRGGGLSDMFGGGSASSLGSSGVAERNLNRFTIAVGLLWAAAIVLLGVLERFTTTY
jgi:preprotein translocase subunit SecG